MLVVGVCNPAGEADGYNGLYLTQSELRGVVSTGSMRDLPVMAEHSGSAVGSVISSFIDEDGRLNCVMHLEKDSLPADLTREFIRKGIAADLSLGFDEDETTVETPVGDWAAGLSDTESDDTNATLPYDAAE
jgi:hypothetical protein